MIWGQSFEGFSKQIVQWVVWMSVVISQSRRVLSIETVELVGESCFLLWWSFGWNIQRKLWTPKDMWKWDRRGVEFFCLKWHCSCKTVPCMSCLFVFWKSRNRMNNCSFTQRVLNIHWSAYSVVWLLHDWCYVKLLPSRRTFCPHHTTSTSLQCHFIWSHIHRVHVGLVVTSHLHFWQNDRGSFTFRFTLLCITSVLSVILQDTSYLTYETWAKTSSIVINYIDMCFHGSTVSSLN